MSLRAIGRSIVSFFRRFIHRPRVEISTANVVGAVALIIIALIALIIRTLPLIGFEVMLRAFDPWYNYRECLYILDNGFQAWFGWYDYTSWVPYGRNIPTSSYPGVPFTCVLMFLFFQSLGMQIDILTFCVLFPAIMGVLGVIAIFFLGRELVNKEVGLLSAFFMAILPAYTQRTVVGFFDNEAVGIFAIIITLFFFVRALRKGSIASSILGGLSLGYLSASWSVYLYIFEVFAIFGLLLILLRRYSRRLLLAYSGTVLGGFIIAICVPRIGPDFITQTVGLIPLGVWGLMILVELSRMFNVAEWRMPQSINRWTIKLRPYSAYLFAAMCAFIVIGLGYLFQSGLILQLLAATGGGGGLLGGLAGKFATVLDPFIRQTAHLLASVGEHLPAPWVTFWYNLNFLILLIPFGFYFAFRRESENDLLLIIFTLTAVYFTGSMIRLALLLAPAAAIMGSYGLIGALRPFRTIYWQRPILTRRRRRITPPISRSVATTSYILIFILIIASTYGAISVTNFMGPPDITVGSRTNYATGDSWYWKDSIETFSWMQSHTAPDAIILSWWDYGYWIRVVGNRSVVADNATANKTQIAWIGRMFNERDPLEALRICRRFNVDYVLVRYGRGQQLLGGDENKWQWMNRIAREVFGNIIVPDEGVYWDNTTGGYEQAFADTIIYNLLYLNASTVGASPPSGLTEPTPGLSPTREILSAFNPVYFSTNHLMKVYQVNYTSLESTLDITAASAYAVHNVPGAPPGSDNLTSLVLRVENTGNYPLEIEKIFVSGTPAFPEPDEIFPIDITTNTGNLQIEPGQFLMVNARNTIYYPIGSMINATVQVLGHTPPLNARISVTVQQPPQYNITALLDESYAYENGTIFVKLENTGEGYCEIDPIAWINQEDIFIIDKADRGRLLYTGEQIGFTLDAGETEFQLEAGENVTLTFFYMSNLPVYYGPNLNVTLTVQATPSPPSPSASTQPDSPSEVSKETSNSVELAFTPYTSLALVSGCGWLACSAFFMARRYFP